MAPSSLAQWAGAAATFVAVLVALFKDSIRERWRKPKLEITCRNEPPWTVRTPLFAKDPAGVLPWTGDSYWVRIKVENKGRTRAEKVQVSLSKLCYSPGLNFSFSEDSRQQLPLNLRWSHYHVPLLDGISPHMAALCDVIALSDPANPYWPKPSNTPPNTTSGSLQLEVDLPPEFHSLRPGCWKLHLRIAAANANPIDKILLFSHTGEWRLHDADMRRECVHVDLT